MGWYLAAASFGYALSLLGSAGLVPWAGWRGALVLAAAATFIGAALGWAAVRDMGGVPGPRAAPQPWRVSAAKLWSNRPAQLVISAYSLHAWELLGMWAWLPAFLVASISRESAFAAMAVPLGIVIAGCAHLVSVAGSVAGGVLADRMGRTRVIMMMSCASIACSLSFGWLLGSALWLIALVAVLYNLTAIGDSAVFSTLLTETVPQDYIGFAFSVRSVLGFGMGALSPWAFGQILDLAGAGGYDRLAWGLAWTALGAGALAGPLLTVNLQRRLEKAAA
jgi:nitrate/nitrite transporter NarK